MPASINRMLSAAASMDANQWFHIVGLISALALGVGFVTGVVSVVLSWKINRDQSAKLIELDRASTEAKTVQQRVEIELSKQQEKAAKAEKALLELQERIKHRRITAQQATRFREELRKLPKGTIDLGFVGTGGSDDAFSFAQQLLMLFPQRSPKTGQ